jgi:hypothetical protein
MLGTVTPLYQHAVMAMCSVKKKAQNQLQLLPLCYSIGINSYNQYNLNMISLILCGENYSNFFCTYENGFEDSRIRFNSANVI